MSAGGALFAMSAFNAVSQISQGYAQRAESNFNASLMEGKARLIDIQAGIESEQYERKKGQVVSQSMAAMAGMGIRPTGSPIAVLQDAMTQINKDKAIGQFNYQAEKNYTMAQAGGYRRAGKAAVYSGWSNAFSSLLQGGAYYKMYGPNKTLDTTSDARRGK